MKKSVKKFMSSFRKMANTHEKTDQPILTIYLNIDPTLNSNRKNQPAWKIELRNAFKKMLEEQVEFDLRRYDDHQQLLDFEAQLQVEIEYYMLNYGGRSLVIISDLDKISILHLETPLNTQLFFGKPYIEPLLLINSKFKKYLLLILAESNIRLTEFQYGDLLQDRFIETNAEVKRRFGRKARTQASDRRELDNEARYAREIAENINDYFLNDPEHDRIIIGGNNKIAHNVVDRLHPIANDALVSVERIQSEVSRPTLSENLHEVLEEHEDQKNMDLISNLVSKHGNNRTAVLEFNDVKQALEEDRLQKLVVSYPYEEPEKSKTIYQAVLQEVPIQFVEDNAKMQLDQYGGIGGFVTTH